MIDLYGCGLNCERCFMIDLYVYVHIHTKIQVISLVTWSHNDCAINFVFAIYVCIFADICFEP